MIVVNQYSLIITTANRGYLEQVMKAVKLGGTTGGTTVLARGAGMHEAEKIPGFSIHPEREIVLILTLREKKQDTMRAIRQKCGFCTKAHDISITVSIEDVMGLSVADMERELHTQELRKTGT